MTRNYNGWFPLQRKMFSPESDLYNKPVAKHVFLILIALANWVDDDESCLFDNEKICIKRGQLLTGIIELQQATAHTSDRLRRALTYLQTTGRITRKTTNKGSLITIIKYDTYQNKESETTSKSTHKSQATAHTNATQTPHKRHTNAYSITSQQSNKKTIKQVNNISLIPKPENPVLESLADKWINHVFEITERREVFKRKDSFIKGIKSIERICELSYEQIDAMLSWIADDEFWKDKCLSPEQMVRLKNGKRKIDSVIAAMKRNMHNTQWERDIENPDNIQTPF